MERANIELYNMDCMDYLKSCKDNQFDLAIVDPPYGLGKRTTEGGCAKNTQVKFPTHYWDNSVPTTEYFTELRRVSKNQIVWGGNYFELHSYRTFVVWDKMTYVPTMSQIEMAVTSFDSPARLVKINSNQNDRIHPTQKPVALYKWLLQNYAKEGDKILDTHLGSGSIALACWDMGFDLVGCELDKEYYDKAVERLETHKKQIQLW